MLVFVHKIRPGKCTYHTKNCAKKKKGPKLKSWYFYCYKKCDKIFVRMNLCETNSKEERNEKNE